MDLRPGCGIRLPSAAQLLREHTPVAVVDRQWPAGRVRLAAYVGVVALPAEIPGRVRVLVTDGEKVLVIWDHQGHPDCLPGGGIEAGETVLDAARYPHPDSFMTVLVAGPARPEEHPGSWTDVDGYVERSAFVPLGKLPAEVRQDPITSVFLAMVFG